MNKKLWSMFHLLWGKAKELPGDYEKGEWVELQSELQRLTDPSPLSERERELLAALRDAHNGTCDEVCEANSSNGLHSSQCYAKAEENFRTRAALLKRFEHVKAEGEETT